MRTATKLLRELVALPSVNPAFLPHTDPRAGEKRLGDFLAAAAASAGLDVELQAVLPERANVLARLSPAGDMHHRVLLAPHLDTVAAASGQFTPRIEADRLYGRGACDTKGSTAAMLTALTRVAAGGRRPEKTEIIFAGLVDEENGQAGSRALVAKGMAADLAIVGEPTRLKVVTAHKGSLWLKLETFGTTAHGSRPDLGVNAVHSMARVVDFLQTAYAAGLSKRRHRLLGQATVSVGVISGGTQANIVPDHCFVMVDRRTLPGETETSVWKDLNAMLKAKKLRAKLVSGKLAPCPPLETSAKLPWVGRFLHSAGQRQSIGVAYFCDAAILASGGIPSIVFGPGDIAQAHTADEWISLKSLDRATDMIERFLRALP